MKTCKDCIIFHLVHWWCRDNDPNSPACEWFVEDDTKEGQNGTTD